jgi:phage/plasmid-like protein (TIGR03299 family)
MTIDHTFLSHLPTDQARRDAIATLPEWRTKRFVERAFPGTNVGGLPWDEALKHAGADFDVFEAKLYAAPRYGPQTRAPKHKAIVRHDNNEVVGVVGSTFGTVQHHNALDGLRAECGRGNATLETVSVEDGGARVAATALLGFSLIDQIGSDKGDALAHFLRAKNAHDGTGCYELSLATLRLVCINGLTSLDSKFNIKLRHSSKVVDRVSAANAAVRSLVEAAKQESVQLERLAQDRITLTNFIEFASELLTGVRGAANTDKKQDRREKDVIALRELFTDGAGNHGVSKYDAYNAVTDWIAVRRDQYKDAAKFANAYRNNETGTAARTRTVALALLNR